MHLGETLLPWKSKDKKYCLYKTPYVAAPIWVLGEVVVKFYALHATFYRHPFKNQNFFWFTSDAFLKRHVSSFWDSYVKFLQWDLRAKSGTQKDYLLRFLRSPTKTTFKCLYKRTPLWLGVMRKEPQEPWRTRKLWERDVEQSAPTHAPHTHCASRQLGTTANQRYYVSWDWLWDACQMARVHWETPCKGFCSEGGPHYQIDQSARNQLECNQVLRVPEKSSRSWHQTINNQSLLMVWKSLGDSFPELYCVYLAKALSCKKVSIRGFLWEDKVWPAIAQRTFARETFDNMRNRERMPVQILVPGSHERLTLRKRVMCARNLGVQVRRDIRSKKGMKTGWEIGFLRSQEKVQRN